MSVETVDVRSQMEPLENIDLSKVSTVGELATAMAKMSFGARNLGECCETFIQMITSADQPAVIYEGKFSSPVYELLQRMVAENLVADVYTLHGFIGNNVYAKNVMVFGSYMEQLEDMLYNEIERVLYVNKFGMANPAQATDGYMKDVVFCDERFALPFMYAVAAERLFGERKTITEFLDGLEKYGGLAKDIVHGAHAWRRQWYDDSCVRALTLSGAMTVAQCGMMVCDLIDSGRVHLVSATGALMGHGLVAAMGLKHYKHRPEVSDEMLRAQSINRVTDTYEPEENFDGIEEIVNEALDALDTFAMGGRLEIAPSALYREIGRICCERFPDARGILKSCYEKNVDVLTPAFVDSEVGNDVYTYNRKRDAKGLPRIVVNPELDSDRLLEFAASQPRRGIFTIGGGVPRNNTQNVAPLADLCNKRADMNYPVLDFQYGVRVDPASVFLGNLGGCTYKEGGSWGKFDFTGDDASRRFAEIRADATIVWPILQKFLFESMSDHAHLMSAEMD